MILNDNWVNQFLMGDADDAHHVLGAHIESNQTVFRVYAPNAKEVRLIGSFNGFNGSSHVMQPIHFQGFYGIQLDGFFTDTLYKYEIITHTGHVLHKADPFAFYAEVRPNTASKVYDLNHYEWNDHQYVSQKKKPYEKPVLVYEMHFGSWKKIDGNPISYREMSNHLIPYLLDQGFTHVEFLPLYEHPFDGSWGYQGTGYYALTSRFGTPHDFMYLVDQLHQAGIGVIMDWVLGHICKDAHGLSYFDGSPLFEFDDQFRRENVTWGTNNLDFYKGITRSFMLSALKFWVDTYHIDGYRIDAVSNLLYYLGNRDNGINHGAIQFLKQAATRLYQLDDRILFMAEDSTDFPQVTHPLEHGGLGFNFKWNMGFMNDVLKYFKTDPIYRKYDHQLVTFGLMYAFNESFILPFSHDEVVHMKGSLINKMPGDYFQKFANWKLLLTFWMTHPGKKLLFMGSEFAQFSEWAYERELDWHLFQFESHQKANQYFKALAHIYKKEAPLFQNDMSYQSFEWLMVDNRDQSMFAYARHAGNESIITVLNMTPNVYFNYELGVPFEGTYEVLLDSDKDIYFGSNLYNGIHPTSKPHAKHGQPHTIELTIGPLAATILKIKREI
jgi:1,4-alpha-glucan branching enzyme